MKYFLLSFAVLSAVATPLYCAPQTQSPTVPRPPIVVLKSDNPRLLKSRSESINQAMQTLRQYAAQPKSKLSIPESFALRGAVELLNRFRATEAVPILADYVALKSGPGMATEIIAFDVYPCVRALIQIGNPSVQEILRRMKPLYEGTEYPESDLHLFAYIIREVDGQEVGLFRLQLAAKDATGTHKLNLLNLIEIYEKRESERQIRRAIELEMEPEPPVTQ